jgi:hypothetical protein
MNQTGEGSRVTCYNIGHEGSPFTELTLFNDCLSWVSYRRFTDCYHVSETIFKLFTNK